MKHDSLIRFAGALMCASILSVSVAGATTEKVLYSFQGGGAADDGDSPFAGLIDVKGTFYGTTGYGGTSGAGTVFSITPGGTEKVLHSFTSGSDGDVPYAKLTSIKDTLYGTTELGGTDGYGTVFSVSRKGSEKVLYSFKLNGDGAGPYGYLIDVNGTLYGTTVSGGAHGYGTIFSISPKGTEKVVYSFTGNAAGDGVDPYAGLISVNGTLYGTTESGGADGYGAVFSFKPTTGAETIVYSFPYPDTDGAYPWASLINVKGTLYGTTLGGGAGYGTVFSVNPAKGAAKLLHTFENSSTDGGLPYAGLIDLSGTLYGTTYSGGANGLGTVFSITPKGTEKVLYSFKGGTDGSNPYADLIDVSGTLYGTTASGGANGYGTVFSIKP